MATEVGKGYVGISIDEKGLQGGLGAMGAALGAKLGPMGSAAGMLLGNNIGKGLKASTGEAESAVGGLASVLGKGGPIGLAAAATLAATVGAASAFYKLGSNFAQTYRTIQRNTGATGQNLAILEGDFRRVASNSSQGFGQVEQAIEEVQRYVGPRSKLVTSLSQEILTLSRISGTDVKGNVDAAMRAFENWGISGKGVNTALNELFVGSQKSGTSFTDLAGNVTKFAPSLRSMGFGFKTSVTMLAQWAKTGVNTSRIMAGMRLAATNLATGQAKSSKAVVAAQLGVLGAYQKVHTATAKQMPAAQAALEKAQLKYDSALQTSAKTAGTSIPEQFSKAIKSIKGARNETDALNIATGVFGKRGAAEITDAIRTGKFNFTDMGKAIGGSRGEIDKVASHTVTLGQTFDIFKNKAAVAFAPLGQRVFNAVNAGLINVMHYLTPVVNWLGNNLPGAISRTVSFVKTFGRVWAQNFRDIAHWVAVVYEDTTGLRHVIGQVFTEAARLIDDAWRVMQPIFKSIGDAISTVNDLLHGHWKQAWNDAVNTVKNFFVGIGNVPKLLWDALVSPFAALSPKIQQAMDNVWAFIKSIPTLIGNFLAAAPSAVFRAFQGAFSWALTAAVSGLSSIWSWLGSLPGKIVSGMGDLATAIFNKAKSAFGGILTGAVNGLSQLWNWLGTLPGTIIGAMGDIGTQLFNAGAHIFGKFADGIRSAIGDVGSAVTSIASTVWSKIPHSPAKEGPLSGKGDPYLSGIATAKRYAMGVTHGTPQVSSAVNNMLTTPNGSSLLAGGAAGGGAAIVIQNANFSDKLDVESFLRQAAWVVQTRRI